MWWILLVMEAWAVWPPVDGEVAPVLVRVEDPAHPDALMVSETAALLAAPPEDGTPWTYEDLGQVDETFEEGPVSGFADARLREVLGVQAWHEAGFRGQGVRVAVFDIQWSTARADPSGLDVAGTADCWSHPSCETPLDLETVRFGYENGVHGLACAEVVRDVAPEAELYLVRVNGRTTFEAAAAWAIRHEIDVISLSMSFFNASFYDGTGPYAEAVADLEAAGVLLVTSAGNYARQHWSGAWTDGDGDGRLDVDGSNSLALELSPGRRTVYVQWDEHFACGASDLDAIVYDPAGFVVARGLRRQGLDEEGCGPVERLTVEAGVEGVYRLEVLARRLTSPFLEVDVLATGGRVVDPVPHASLADPASSPLAFVVGAVRADGYLDADVESFSSWGPSRAGVPKPDVAGPNGVTVDGYGTTGFFGTSASTPAVAGTLAVVLSRWPELTPRQASERLRAWALDDGVQTDPRGDDPRWGAGKVRLPPPDASASGCLTGPGSLALLVPLVPAAWFRRRRSGACRPPRDRTARRRRPPGSGSPA